MRSVARAKDSVVVLAVLCILGPGPARAESFENAPISCGSLTQFKGCTATFDGRRLRIDYTHPEGRHAVVIYRKCLASTSEINCIDGEWQAAGGSGPIGSRSLGLRNGLPF
jgi:hypothetical protein